MLPRRKGTRLCVSLEGGEQRWGLRSPDFTRKTQATLLSLCDTSFLQQWGHLSRDVSGITTQEEAAGRSGLSLPS